MITARPVEQSDKLLRLSSTTGNRNVNQKRSKNKHRHGASTNREPGSARARARLAEMKRQEARARTRRRFLVGVTAVIVAGALGIGIWLVARQVSAPNAAGPVAGTKGRSDLPPWGLPADPGRLAEAAGLQASNMEGTAAHFHSHLDITVNGQPLALPGAIGVDAKTGSMSELHTHDERGVLHVESHKTDGKYTLGQLFAEWDVRLDGQGIGGLTNNKTDSLRAYVDGKPFTGDPATIELGERRQISLIYGPRNATDNPPSSFAFDANE
ncbi:MULTISPECIES: twin-arginine translocation signal domain-containing protein [Actinomycetes]|uniref:Twin-arginine translocation signal domain-containing protein n=2 Tax=Actinomycetes TaxID=1760 RepID=A0A967AXC1_9MICO|nr:MULTISPECIES: twin-arginine translocation signal domain-containing protein [Actinomycetes]NHN54443.1 twin-arginine translocation signal domain-containing protein [Metallococcus carri]NOP36718.1 twin-arginine translocation signal domain-containing protein [Calidifontibacter sp. DB2511S]